MRVSLHLPAATMLLLPALSVQAATVVYNNESLWLSNVSNTFTYGGPAVTPGGAISYSSPTGLVIPELQVTGRMGGIWTLDAVNAATNGSQPWYQWNSGTILRSGDKTATNTVYVTISFPTPVSAFAFQFGAGGSGGAPASVTISPTGHASLNTTTLQQPTFTFYGIVSDTQVFSSVSIYINDVNRYIVLDNISTATASTPPPPSEVPEMASYLYLLTGLALTAYGSRSLRSAGGQTAS
jgi:hypothetical protein